MKKDFFNKDYVKYWKKRVNNKSGESIVPGKLIENFFIQKLGILKKDFVLDLGCGHGRLFPLLKKFSHHIWGADVTVEAVKEASEYSYQKIVKGSAEKTRLQKEFFDKIVCWATYDVVDQEKALIEENRILKTNGLLLITGKSNNYEVTDGEAFIAERNAKLKNFPNHFTDVYGLINSLGLFGFELVSAYGFKRRGDFGQFKYFNILKSKKKSFYEFLLILKKVGPPKIGKIKICDEYSKTAIGLAKLAKFKNTKSFFLWHKKQNEK